MPPPPPPRLQLAAGQEEEEEGKEEEAEEATNFPTARVLASKGLTRPRHGTTLQLPHGPTLARHVAKCHRILKMGGG